MDVVFGLWPNLVEPQARRYICNLRAMFQPQCGWLISGAPSEQKKAAARIVSRWTES